MLKKFIFSMMLALVGLFTLGFNTFATTTTFTYTNLYSTYYALISPNFIINPEAAVFVLDIPDNDYTVYSEGGVRSYIILYSGSGGTGTTYTVYLDTLDDNLSVNKTYIVQMSDIAFTPLSASILLMTNLRTSSAPSGYVAFMNAETEYSFTTPNKVVYYDAFEIVYTSYFINQVPSPTDPTRTGFSFVGWKDQNGDIYDYQLPPREDQLNADGEFLLYSTFEENILIDVPYFFPDFPMPTTPIGIILYNTGFYTTEGMIFLFAILVIAANIALWYFKTPLFVNLLASAIIVALFMIGGYLPLYVSIIMIGLIIVLFLNLKGGLLNE